MAAVPAGNYWDDPVWAGSLFYVRNKSDLPVKSRDQTTFYEVVKSGLLLRAILQVIHERDKGFSVLAFVSDLQAGYIFWNFFVFIMFDNEDGAFF